MSNSGSSPPSGNSGGWWSRMSRSEQIIAAIVGAAVAGIFAVIVALIDHSSGTSQNPQAGQSTSAASSPTATITTPTLTSSPATAPTTPQPKVILQDNFCSNVNGWNNVAYSNCTLLIHTKSSQPNGDITASEPTGSSLLYPRAPSSITVEVTAQMIAGSAQGDPQFGVSCRASPDSNDPNGYGYAFIVRHDLVRVIKYSNNTGQVGAPLAEVPVTLDLTHSNLLMAQCDSLNGGSAVKLALWVNGRHLLDATNKNPVTGGTVALFAATTGSSPVADVVQFTNFKVTQL